jgi:hypothetical protein
MTVRKAAPPTCSQYTTVLGTWREFAETTFAPSTDALRDPFTAARYVEQMEWVASPQLPRFIAEVRAIAAHRLGEVTRRPAAVTRIMVVKYLRDALWVCQLKTPYSEITTAVLALDERRAALKALAAKRPWYPEGYTEWDGGIAWEWIDHNDCGYSSGYCWGIHVITRDGCPSGLYAEINILSGATVVDYANDSLGSLAPGTVAKLDFVSFEEGQGDLRGSVTKINCY